MIKMDSLWKDKRGLSINISNSEYLKWWTEYLKTE